MASLIDELLPDPHVAMRHQRRIPLPPSRVYAAIGTADLGRSPVVALLFALRALPALLTTPRETLRRRRARGPEPPLKLRGLAGKGFGVVAEEVDQEIVLGVYGRFWKATGELHAADRACFRLGPPEGTALVAWNFRVEPAARGACLLSTETRIRCADPAVLRTFRRYWLIVRPGSALIRRAILRSIAREAAR